MFVIILFIYLEMIGSSIYLVFLLFVIVYGE